MKGFREEDIAQLVELQGVYDGWSVAVLKDGTLVNRWADENGDAIPGYERRWKATRDYLNHQDPA